MPDFPEHRGSQREEDQSRERMWASKEHPRPKYKEAHQFYATKTPYKNWRPDKYAMPSDKRGREEFVPNERYLSDKANQPEPHFQAEKTERRPGQEDHFKDRHRMPQEAYKHESHRHSEKPYQKLPEMSSHQKSPSK